MNLDFFENLINHNEHKKNKETINNEKINEEEVKLAYKLGAIEIYTVDRIEENVAVLQNNETKQIKNIKKTIINKKRIIVFFFAKTNILRRENSVLR